MSINVKVLKGKIYPQGDSGTIEIGTVTTGEAGTDVEVTNTGTRSNAILNFKIPKGDKGDPGSIDNAYTKSETDAKFKNVSSESTTDGYSANYINSKFSPQLLSCSIHDQTRLDPLYHPVDIENWQEDIKIGTELSVSNGKILIGSNINHVKISYDLDFVHNSTAEIIFQTDIKKNSTALHMKANSHVFNLKYYRSSQPDADLTTQIPECNVRNERIISVSQGDLITVQIFGGDNLIFGGDFNNKASLIIEKID